MCIISKLPITYEKKILYFITSGFNPSDIEISFSGNFFFVSVKKWYFEKKFLIPEDAVIEKMSAYVINGDLVVEFPCKNIL